jgi:hypothetical protein
MLLTEIKNFPEKHDATFTDALNQFIEKHGVKKFEGGQATVIDRGSHVWRVWFDDPGYERFLVYVEAHKGNKFLPKILSKVREEPTQFKRMPKGKTIKYVKIEKLTDPGLSILTDALDTLYFASIPPAKLPDTVEDLAEMSMTLKMQPHSDAEHEEIRDEILKHKDFFKVVLDLMKNHDANDLTSGNIMLRGSTPVITDPFKD